MISKRTGQHSSSNDSYVEDLDMVEQIVHCYELHEALSSQIRHLSQCANEQASPKAILREMSSYVSVEPHDHQLRPISGHVRLLCDALGLSLELDSHPKKDLIMGEASRVAVETILSTQAHLLSLHKRSDLPAHVTQALFPDCIGDISPSDPLEKPEPFHVRKSFKYRDNQTGHSVTCLVHDCGTSHLMGDWFEVSCGSEEPLRIMQDEMF